MAEVAGRPFAEWLVVALREQGVLRIVFCTGHRHEAIERHFGAGEAFGVKILHSREEEPLGTAGALRLAVSRDAEGGERFFVLNGDSLCAFDLDRLSRFHAERRARATLWTVPTDDASRYGTVVADPDGRVLRFVEKTPRSGAEAPTATATSASRVNAGVAVFERSELAMVPEGRAVSLETEVLPRLAGPGGGLWAVPGEGPLLDIGTPESYRTAGSVLASLSRPARRRRFVVLDRDGTLIEECHYLSDPADVALTPGAGEALRRLARRGLGLVVVTNQSAIGRGIFGPDRLDAIHAEVVEQLAREGVSLAGIYVCPHVPEDGCACRKPRRALLDRAGRDLGFDPADAFVVGDKASDIELGKSAGASTILVRTGYGREVEASGGAGADWIVDDLRQAAARIEECLDSVRDDRLDLPGGLPDGEPASRAESIRSPAAAERRDA